MTTCVQGGICLFGTVVNGDMRSHEAGVQVERAWANLAGRFPKIRFGERIVMPNHFHGVLWLFPEEDESYPRNEAGDRVGPVELGAVVRVFKSIGRFRGDSSFRTWIYRIAINLSLNHIRDNKRERASEIDDAALTTEAVGVAGLVGRQRTQRLREAIDELPPKQRMVLELRIYDELPFREVGQLADCTENAAKVNFHHAMRRLRSIMSGEEQ